MSSHGVEAMTEERERKRLTSNLGRLPGPVLNLGMIFTNCGKKNMLMTQRQMLHAQNLQFLNPERILKITDLIVRVPPGGRTTARVFSFCDRSFKRDLFCRCSPAECLFGSVVKN
ncbi:hypothetical protein HYC85_029535 [Camellia sinensis]|uniref:Uncharacterized protein n=1 Tax=Camellia sinensis TaxID=4442 RepID=A0A7J7G270_CAMSI|nr:hypothetical protein HYC85_029535 [Camellia sinensis]